MAAVAATHEQTRQTHHAEDNPHDQPHEGAGAQGEEF